MTYAGKGISSKKVSAFLKILPVLEEAYGDQSFEVPDAIGRINRADLGVWCYRTGKVNIIEKREAEESGLETLDLQMACHRFAGQSKMHIMDEETGRRYQPLKHVGDLTYEVRKTDKSN